LKGKKVGATCLQQKVEENYYTLLEFLNTEWNVAKALSFYMDIKDVAIYRALNRFSFKKNNMLEKFIDASEKILMSLQEMDINCNALLISKNNIEKELIVKGKEVSEVGVRVLCPQLFISTDGVSRDILETNNIIEFFTLDVELADIVVVSGLDKVEMAMLDGLNFEKKEIIEIKDKKRIHQAAIRATIKKNGGLKWIIQKNVA
jgi:hypothetical protein